MVLECSLRELLEFSIKGRAATGICNDWRDTGVFTIDSRNKEGDYRRHITMREIKIQKKEI